MKILTAFRIDSDVHNRLKEKAEDGRPMSWHLHKALNNYLGVSSHKEAAVQKPKKENAAKFFPPTVREVNEYCRARGNSIDAEAFVNYYESSGWCRGSNRTPIKDWMACVRTWERNNKEAYQYGGKRKLSLSERSEQQTREILSEFQTSRDSSGPIRQDVSIVWQPVDLGRG